MTLSRYLLRRLGGSVLLVAGVFAGLLLLLDMVEQMRILTEYDVAFIRILHLAALNVPRTLHQIAPLIVVLASMSLFLALSRASELVVVRAAGRSGARMMAPLFLAALVVGAAYVAVMNPLVASTSREYVRLLSALRGDPVSTVSVTEDGLWLRQGTRTEQVVIRAVGASPDGTRLTDATFLFFVPGEGVQLRLQAGQAQLVPGAWELRGVKRWDLRASNPERSSVAFAQLSVPTELTPSQIRDNFARPGAIPIWELPGFIRALEGAGFAALEHRVWLQMELSLPLLIAGMMLMASAASMHHARSGHAGLRALATILAGFALFFLRNLAQVLGENGQIPVALATWSMPFAATLLAVGLLLHLEES